MILPLDTNVIADLDRVGVLIERDGLAAVPDHLLRSLADDAKRLGIRPIAAAVLTDPIDPIVARERAFSRLAIGLIGATA
jgi:hypothetical protein